LASTNGATGFFNAVVRLLFRLVFLAIGLVFAASLLVAVGLLAAFWFLRAGWAKLTGRPVAPFIVRVDPRAGFSRFRDAGVRPEPAGRSAQLHDVTDVEAREVPPSAPSPGPSAPR
jgi:hypothetical protein